MPKIVSDSDLKEVLSLFFRGKYLDISFEVVSALRKKRFNTKNLAMEINQPRTSVNDVLLKMEKIGIVQREWRYSPWALSSQIGRKLKDYFSIWKAVYEDSTKN